MKAKIHIIIGITFLLIILQTISVSALYKKAYELNKDELLSEVWSIYEDRNVHYKEDVIPEHVALEVSITRYEMREYLKDYKPLNKDITVSDVAKEFYEHMKDVFSDTTINIDDDGNIYEIDKDGNKYNWTYDSKKDDFICTDSKGNMIKSYDRYHLKSESEQATTITHLENKSGTNNQGSKAYTISEKHTSANENKNEVVETKEAVEATKDTAVNNSNSGMSSSQIIILSVIGGAVIIGIGAVGYMAIKNKKSK